MTFDELSVSLFCLAFTVSDHYLSAQQHCFYFTVQFPSFVSGIIHVHMMACCRNGMFGLRVEYDNICIAVYGNGALAREHAEDLCRIGAGYFYIFVKCDPSLMHALTVQ